MAVYCLYILASKRNGTLYIGVTNDLARRVSEHMPDAVPGFTKRYGVHLLVYYETYDDVSDALARELAMKNWRRAWKVQLIERANPRWRDFYGTLNE